MHRLLAITSVVALLIATPAAAHAMRHPDPRLELPASWFFIVEPWRYDEERRYEAGWNRGADVDVVAGSVRAPVSGRVRFAGDVAGRSVVTIESRVDGLPVVVTLTGLDRWRVAEGDRIVRGAIVGWGSGVHVGMYDQARRSRYLPVVGARGDDGSAARSEGAPDRSPLADVVASRLMDAIRGEVAPGGAAGNAGFGKVMPSATSGPSAGIVAADGMGLDRVLRPPSSRDARAMDVVGLATRSLRLAPPHTANGARWRHVPGAGARRSQPIQPVVRGHLDMRHVVVGTGHAVGARTWARQPIRSPEVGFAAGADSGAAADSGRAADSGDAEASGAAAADEDPDAGGDGSDSARSPVADRRPRELGLAGVPRANVPVARPGHDDRAAGSGLVGEKRPRGAPVDGTWSVPAALAALLAVIAFARRRTRSSAPVQPAPVVRPLPTILPTVRPQPVLPARTDGHTTSGGTPLAWADHEAGTSTHEPELLRHHADLLSERAAAPGPRVHDDRRGRDHPLPATHGP